jgi:hypothetical protein
MVNGAIFRRLVGGGTKIESYGLYFYHMVATRFGVRAKYGGHSGRGEFGGICHMWWVAIKTMKNM